MSIYRGSMHHLRLRRSNHRALKGIGGRKVIRTRRLPDGQLVLKEKIEGQVAGPNPQRIEKDKKGRM